MAIVVGADRTETAMLWRSARVRGFHPIRPRGRCSWAARGHSPGFAEATSSAWGMAPGGLVNDPGPALKSVAVGFHDDGE